MNLKGYYREDQSKAMSWCLNNGIRIHIRLGDEYLADEWRGSRQHRKKFRVTKIKPYDDGLVKIWFYNNGYIKISDNYYTQDEANIKIWETYCHMYDVNL